VKEMNGRKEEGEKNGVALKIQDSRFSTLNQTLNPIP